MSDEKQAGPGQTQTPNPAAERRADAVRALEEERRGYEMRGLDDRVKQVDAEIKRLKSEPKGRRAAESAEA